MSKGVQSVLFDRRRFTEMHARNWLALHRFVAMGKVHATKNYLRFRQFEPRDWERYATKSLPNYPGVKLVVRVTGPHR